MSDDEGQPGREARVCLKQVRWLESGACEPSAVECPMAALDAYSAQSGFQYESFSSDNGGCGRSAPFKNPFEQCSRRASAAQKTGESLSCGITATLAYARYSS